MHTVLAQLCTGCELCIAPCPVDCISMVPAAQPQLPAPELSRQRYGAHNERAARRAAQRAELLAERKLRAQRSLP
jgi:electron transport complex protein RnfB